MFNDKSRVLTSIYMTSDVLISDFIRIFAISTMGLEGTSDCANYMVRRVSCRASCRARRHGNSFYHIAEQKNGKGNELRRGGATVGKYCAAHGK